MSESASMAPVAFPALTLWAVARLARERGDSAFQDALVRVLDAAVAPSVRRTLIEPASSDMPAAVLPFVGDSLDTLGLGAWISTQTLPEMKEPTVTPRFYSALSFVEAGYFELVGGTVGARYIDSVRAQIKPGRAPSGHSMSTRDGDAVMTLQNIDVTLATLRSIDRQPAQVVVPESGDELFQIRWPALGEMLPDASKVSIVASLIRRDAAGKAVVARRLSGLTLQSRSKRVWRVMAPAERVIELHAAAMAGQGLQISAQGMPIGYLVLPDFTRPGLQGVVRFSPEAILSPLVVDHFGTPDGVPVSRDLASRLVERHNWCAPDRFIDLHELCQGLVA